MRGNYIISVDQSTSSTKAVLFNDKGERLYRFDVPHKQYYPQPGWVEHDAEEIYANTVLAIKGLIEKAEILKEDVVVIGLTNQRETVVVWDKDSGKPVYQAIVWQCQRAGEICSRLIKKGYSQIAHKKTGVMLSPNFSASKVRWILENVEGVSKKAAEGKLLLGTIDSWLIWKLTGGESHFTEHTNACRTQLYNIFDLKWDEELLDVFEIPKVMLPEVKSANEIFGKTTVEGFFSEPVKIAGVLGDSNGALFGQNCFEKGELKITYGTGSSVMINVGDSPVMSKQGILSSVAWGYNGKVSYVMDGNMTCTGGTISWLKNNLRFIKDSSETEELAKEVSDNGGVYFVPAFAGLGAPYWKHEPRALICGMSTSTEKGHVIRAALESIAYQITDSLDILRDESGSVITEASVDGAPTRNDLLMQFQADIAGIRIKRNSVEELSATGAAYMAGLAVGIWNDFSELRKIKNIDKVFEPRMDRKKAMELYNGWKTAVKRAEFGTSK